MDNLDARLKAIEDQLTRSAQLYPAMVERVGRLEGQVKEMRSTISDLKEMNEEIKSLTKLMVQLQCGIDAINTNIANVGHSLEKQGARIGTLEGQSGNNAKSAIKWFATTVGSIIIGAIMGALVAKMGL